MVRTPTLTFDRGTLVLHPPPRGKSWHDYATWDDRIERFRIPAHQYRHLVEALQQENISFTDEARAFVTLELVASFQRTPYPHQQEALTAWRQQGRRGVVVLPTASGKTYLAQLAMEATPRSTLVIVPTLDLMHQWYAHLRAAFPDREVGLLGGGSRDTSPLLVATYDSAAIHAETLGNRYGLLIFDECHHLPGDFYRTVAEYSLAPYRLGLTATPERADGRHTDLEVLIGPEVYRRGAEALAGDALAPYEVVQIHVRLSLQERARYDELLQTRNAFLQSAQINLRTGWQEFVRASATMPGGRRAMLAHNEARAIALGTHSKLRVLEDLIAQHYPEQTLIFTHDNNTVYRISQDFLIPAITHQTPVKERYQILQAFREGRYRTLVAAHVLDEGVDVPEARVAILLAGSGSTRQFIQRLGRVLRKGASLDKRAILYEVVAEATLEEATSQRRRGSTSPQTAYETRSHAALRAADAPSPWGGANPEAVTADPSESKDRSGFDRDLPDASGTDAGGT
ncbi:DEAD/DEAH box helicase family protein [Anthocerotibacter panamensis]|uniref:DEAD/DEAH box helicase family protein n=1 Tax=Anthocerotibacter panamensis TaxID=2857077 RepID=UPI001FD8C6E8|nr:DEAD/DEAH box helicase family protein [Anthocerotibacter panamensis]